MECSRCKGKGCKLCDETGRTSTGRLIVSSGFLESIPRSIWMALELSDLYSEGIPPVAGGSLDQTVWFNAAHRIAKHAKAEIQRPAKMI